MILIMSFKVNSVVDTVTGTALDYMVDSPSVNGKKLEVKLKVTGACTAQLYSVDTGDYPGEAALCWSKRQRVQDHGELLDNQRQHGSLVAQR